MQIPVIKKNGSSSELVILDLNDVIYICVENRNLILHTTTDQYQHMSTLSDLQEHLYDHGFELLDRTNLVNQHKIKKLDKRQGKVYFEDQPSEDDKFATISFMKQKMLEKTLARRIANNTNSTLEYSVKDEASSPTIKSRRSPYKT